MPSDTEDEDALWAVLEELDVFGNVHQSKDHGKPVFCLFDTSETEETEKLPDAFLFELVLLYNYTEHTNSCLAKMFCIDPMELYEFTHDWVISGNSTARYWMEGLGITDLDKPLIEDALSAAAAKAAKCEEYGLNYVEYSFDLLVTLEAGVDRQSTLGIPGVETLEELVQAWEFYATGASAVSTFLERAGTGVDDGLED